jgi:hypothetical protein
MSLESSRKFRAMLGVKQYKCVRAAVNPALNGRLGKRKHIPTAEFQGGAAGEEAAHRAERAYSLGLWSARVVN